MRTNNILPQTMQAIKNTILLSSLLATILFSLQGCLQEIDYSDEQFNTIIDRDLTLQEYARLAKESKGEKKKEYLIKFFKAFPSDFETYFKINHNTCYRDTLYTIGSRYGYVFSHNPWGKFYPINKVVESIDDIPKEKASARFSKEMVKLYYSTKFKDNNPIYEHYDGDIMSEVKKFIPPEIFCRKMISVAIGGFSDAEMYFYELRQVDDDTLWIKLLKERTDDEIASYFYFGYDGPHPDNWRDVYEHRYNKIYPLSPRVANLMKKAYERLLSEEHCEGH